MKGVRKILWNNFQPGDVLYWINHNGVEFAPADLVLSIVITETERWITFLELETLEIREEASPLEYEWTHLETLRVKC